MHQNSILFAWLGDLAHTIRRHDRWLVYEYYVLHKIAEILHNIRFFDEEYEEEIIQILLAESADKFLLLLYLFFSLCLPDAFHHVDCAFFTL